MQKQFQYNKLNAKGDALEKEMSQAFDAFEQMLDEKFLQSAGKSNYTHGIMLSKLEEAWLYAVKAMTARGDLKN